MNRPPIPTALSEHDKRSLRGATPKAEDWRTEAAAWLRRKAEEAIPASLETGHANPAHALPDRLARLADELDAEQKSAPIVNKPKEYGMEAWIAAGHTTD